MSVGGGGTVSVGGGGTVSVGGGGTVSVGGGGIVSVGGGGIVSGGTSGGGSSPGGICGSSGSSTFTFAFFFCLPCALPLPRKSASTVASPTFSAVTRPASVTLATAGSLLLQVTSPSTGSPPEVQPVATR